MATADIQQPVQDKPTPAIPDYLADPDAVLKDTNSKWRYGRAPDYSKTRKVYAESEFAYFIVLHRRAVATYDPPVRIREP